jgi:hypothetical protein
MKQHICRVILVVSILALVTTFVGSASAANPHHHHRQVAPCVGAMTGGNYAPRVYVSYPKFTGYGGGTPHHGSYGVPHHNYHHSHHSW